MVVSVGTDDLQEKCGPTDNAAPSGWRQLRLWVRRRKRGIGDEHVTSTGIFLPTPSSNMLRPIALGQTEGEGSCRPLSQIGEEAQARAARGRCGQHTMRYVARGVTEARRQAHKGSGRAACCGC